ncbi:calcyclin-binding protein-like isoform X2 [Pecten maximus]|uniref:calcyclin-binding protein-like isoform X2 n=1 Tax=Pecten maximus TaxID=6579 RepID=UPI00145917B9|nr:calcyclin-binding protein-like isoform X2 [Pecten maximus]
MSTDELRKDAAELKGFLETASRPRVKDILSVELRKIETDIINKEEADRTSDVAMETETAKPTTEGLKIKQPRSVSYIQEKTYAWDQSEKFMKIYAQLPDVQSLPTDKITCDFTSRSFRLQVNELKNKNHEWHIANLMEEIVPDSSYFKVKTNSVLVMLKKKAVKTWPYVTEREKKAQDSKKPKADESKDPNDSLMDMLKQMYDDGDDEMKKNISKAWSDSRNKQSVIE